MNLVSSLTIEITIAIATIEVVNINRIRDSKRGLLERASLQVLTSVDRLVHVINYKVYSRYPL